MQRNDAARAPASLHKLGYWKTPIAESPSGDIEYHSKEVLQSSSRDAVICEKGTAQVNSFEVLGFSQFIFLLLLAENELMYRLVCNSSSLRIGALLLVAICEVSFIFSTLFHQTYGTTVLHILVTLLPVIPFGYFIARLARQYFSVE
jgi:hypothetical protein